MVVSKDAKRKQRKEDTPPLVTSPVNVPKRTKVQAQRKFAQGQGTSSTSYTSVGAATSSAAAAAAAAGTSNPATPVKDNRDPPPELFTHKRPKTEDFLTYLCFRGTSVLPSHLDFLNQNSNNKTTPGKEEETVTKSTSDSKKQKDDANSKSDATTSKVDTKPKADEVNSIEKSTAKKEDKPEIMPFAVRKRADQVVDGNRRLRNTLDKNTKLRDRSAKKEDTNRRSPRTRSKIEDEPQDEENVTEPMETEEENHINEPPKKEKVEEEKTPINKNKRKGNVKSATKESEPTKNIVEEIPEVVTKPPAAVKTKTAAPMSPPPPPAEENPVKEKTPVEEKAKPSVKGKAKKESTPVEPVGRMTRQRAFFEPVKLPYKDPDAHEKEEKSEPVEQESPKVDKKSEFSSDDEQPLAKAIKLARKASKKGPKKGKKKAVTPVEEEQPKEEIRSPTPEVQSNKSVPIPVTPAPVAGNRRKLVRSSKSKTPVEARAESAASHKSDVSSKKSVKETKKVPIKRKKGVGKSDEDESESNAPPKTKVEKKMPESNHLSSPPPAEASEGEVKSGRPMRKTKEAATIYMELIGQKLNLGEFDDEGESIDSFPELPNAKKTQQREKELKQNVGRPKGRKNNRKRQKAGDDVEAKTVEHEKAGEEIKIDEKKIVQKKKGKNFTGGGEKLEKSFSDSDDEPLATKLVKPAEPCKPEKRPSPRKSVDKSEKLDAAAKQDATAAGEGKKVPQATPLALIKEIPKASIPETKILPKSPPTSPPHKASPANQKDASAAIGAGKQVSPTATGFPALDRFPSPKINPTFLTPKFDRTIERRIPIDPSPPPLSSLSKTHMPAMSPKPGDALNLTTSSPSGATTSKKFEPDSFLSANLMPSKEESGKIFGIASVSLAQSSGPDNTKCTLGKCGSIHKPVLGPVVPTEAYLGEQLSSKERRKAKVNMTHEQIQKWLIECSSNPDEIQDDLDDDFDDHLKPMTFAPSPTLARDEKDSTSPSTSSKVGKDSVKVESVWSGKGPSLKATPVVMKDDIKPPPPVAAPATKPTPPAEPTKLTRATKAAVAKTEVKMEVKDGPAEKPKSITPIKSVRDRMKSPKPSTSSTPSPKHLRAAQPAKIEPKATPVKTTPVKTTAAKTTSVKTTPVKTTPVKTTPVKTTPVKTTPVKTTPVKTTPVKTIKRQTVYSSKLSDASKRKPMTNNFAAFSPENETSVYSFDKEDDVLPPTAKPFRRHSRRESVHEETSQGDKSLKIAAEKTPVKEAQQNNSVSVTLSPDENSKSIKVSLDNAEKSPPAKKGKVADKPAANDASAMGDSDSEGHTFYIPLQGIGPANTSSGKSSDVIQGVAVKLGREGPDGPNQRVIMHATLVTKAQMGTNPTPIPDSMNVHEIVKSLLSSNKDSSTSNASKSVPVGTVQPRFKSTSNNMQQQQPSTAAAADQQNPSGSGLTRVNSNSSLFSGSNKSRAASATAKKPKDDNPIKMCNNTAFPHRDDPTQMVEAPIFRPTEKEFQDPIDFIDRITPIAARFGICKIIPPESFKPECRISDDMRFNAYNQYVHKMLHRWGPSAKELSAIKKYLATQSIAMTHPPWIGGMEVDLPRLYHTVQELGGLKEVIEKKKWARVAEEMCIPKLAQDRVTKLDDIYCKYLLPYDTLSPAERQKLFDEVEADWAKREARARRNADRCINPESVSNEDDEVSSEDDEDSDEEVDGVSMECIVKGRSMPLNAFFRIARNTMALWFKNTEPTVADIEAEFWRHVAVRDSHVCVHSGSIDSSGWGYGFPTPGPKTKASPCARHPWNLKVLTNNPGSVLRSLGPVTGVTVPTLHVGMLFSACCWYRDPHGLSWIEYLHTGASKIWYGIPDEQSSSFRTALTALIPTHCQNKTIWLPCDTAMVPPHMLTDRGVSLCRIEQKPGEFVVIFPRAYTSSVATGYEVSESVYFATSSWLDLAKDDFKDIHESCEPAMFSLEQLLFALASDQRVTIEILSLILPMLTEVYDKEVAARQQLKAAGVISTEKLLPNSAKSKQKSQQSEERECDLCRANLYISMIKTDEGNIYCLQHALKNINNGNVQAKQCKLIFTYNIEDVENILKNLRERLTQMPKKKTAAGSSGRKNSQSK